MLTVDFHKHLGCLPIFMNKSPWDDQPAQPWSRSVALVERWVQLWPTVQVHRQAGAPQLCPSQSELPSRPFLYVSLWLCRGPSFLVCLLLFQASVSTLGGPPQAWCLPPLPVVLAVEMPRPRSSRTCPPACCVCLPQLSSVARSHPTFAAALLLWLTCAPQSETQGGALSVCGYNNVFFFLFPKPLAKPDIKITLPAF